MKAKTTDPTTQLRDRCLSHFATLRVPVQPGALDELLTRAEKEHLSYLSFLDRLLGAEAGARRERAVARPHPRSPVPREQDLGRIRLELQSENVRPDSDGRTGQRRLHPAPRQSRHGGLEWDREKSHDPGDWAESLRPWLSRALSDLSPVAGRPHRFPGRQDSSHAAAALCEAGTFDHRRIWV